MIVSPTAHPLTEGGASKQFTLALETVPLNPVTIDLTFDGAQLDASPSSLIFPATSAALDPQTVTISADDNAIGDGTRSPQITFAANSGDSQYTGVAIGAFAATIADDDVSALTIANVSVAEPAAAGGTSTANLTVTMSLARTQTVTADYATAVGTATGGASCTGGVDFAVERLTPGLPTTVHFTVVAICGDWNTFVGGGTGAGF